MSYRKAVEALAEDFAESGHHDAWHHAETILKYVLSPRQRARLDQ